MIPYVIFGPKTTVQYKNPLLNSHNIPTQKWQYFSYEQAATWDICNWKKKKGEDLIIHEKFFYPSDG